MRFLKSTPKDREFYNEHGGNLSAYYTIANIGQFLSAASLALAVFSLLSDAIAGRGVTVATGGVIAAAVLIGLFVELANRKLARPAIRPLVVKDQFAEDDVKRKRHRLVTRFSRGGLLLVGGLSFALSFMGSLDAGQLITDEAPPANLDSLQQVFTADTAALFAPYQIRATAALQQFEATRANREKAAEDYTSCANRGNKWCKKKKRTILAAIDAARADYNATAAVIATERGNALSAAMEGRNASYKSARTEATESAAESAAAAASNGYIFAVLTFAGQVVFYLMFYLILQIEAGSEIAEEIQPNEFHNQPSVWSDFKALLKHRTERGARRFLAYIFGSRDRLEKDLPYVSLWTESGEMTDTTTTSSLATAEVKTEPRFYQKADDPHTAKSSALYSTPDTPPHTNPTHGKRTHETPEVREAKQRLKQYKKRVGEHSQKAKVQERKEGQVKPRTAEAIANNQQWVAHYEQLLNQLSGNA